MTDLIKHPETGGPDMVTHIIDRYFDGVRANFTRWIGWNPSKVQRRAESGNFTAPQQKEILGLAYQTGVPITPADFFPEFLPQSSDVSQSGDVSGDLASEISSEFVEAAQ